MTNDSTHLRGAPGHALCGVPETLYFADDARDVSCHACLVAEVERLRRDMDATFDAGLEEGALCAERCERRAAFDLTPRSEGERAAYTNAAAAIRQLKGTMTPLRAARRK